MPLKQSIVYLPEMSLTLVRRVTSTLPYNHYLFRTAPQWTKAEIKEYLRAVYGVNVAQIATYISAPKVRRAPGKRNLLFKVNSYKKVYVRLSDDSTLVKTAAPAAELK